MSGKPKPLAIQVMERSRAPGTARLVLLGYAYFGDPDGSRITAGPERVAARAGVTVRTLERYRPELLELGELEVVRLGRSGRHAEYRICLPPAVSNGANLAEPASPTWRSQDRQVGDGSCSTRQRDPAEDPPTSSPSPSAVDVTSATFRSVDADDQEGDLWEVPPEGERAPEGSVEEALRQLAHCAPKDPQLVANLAYNFEREYAEPWAWRAWRDDWAPDFPTPFVARVLRFGRRASRADRARLRVHLIALGQQAQWRREKRGRAAA